jgi:hypothetical protein
MDAEALIAMITWQLGHRKLIRTLDKAAVATTNSNVPARED